MENTIELKDCPFCGGKPKLEQTKRKEITLKCTSCLVKFQFSVRNKTLEWLEEEMIKDWNTRVLSTNQAINAKKL